ncbi:hypothetical protein OG21DRAFT_1498418, partial [Imleria badia]
MRCMEMAADTLYNAKVTPSLRHLAISPLEKKPSLLLSSMVSPSMTVSSPVASRAPLGMSHGKGGFMHIFTPSFFGGNGIVDAQVLV